MVSSTGHCRLAVSGPGGERKLQRLPSAKEGILQHLTTLLVSSSSITLKCNFFPSSKEGCVFWQGLGKDRVETYSGRAGSHEGNDHGEWLLRSRSYFKSQDPGS